MEQVNRIVVLDDEAELRNMLQRFLTGHGFRVRAVADGKQLDKYLQRERRRRSRRSSASNQCSVDGFYRARTLAAIHASPCCRTSRGARGSAAIHRSLAERSRSTAFRQTLSA